MKKILPIILLVIVLAVSCDSTTEKPALKEKEGLTSSSIILGSSAALSDHAAFLGTQYVHGAKLYFNEVNEQGGIHGRQIEVISLDDQYDPSKTVANTQSLINHQKVFALFNYVGTPTSVAVLPIIKDVGIPIFGFFTGAVSLRGEDNSNIFHLRDCYYAEAEGAVRYYVDKLGLKNIGVFYQEDAFGISVLKGIQLALQKRGLEPLVTDTFLRGSLDIQDSVDWITKEDLDVIMMVGTYSPLAKFIRLTHDRGMFPKFSTVSFVGSKAYARELTEIQKINQKTYNDILVTQVVPSPFASNYSAAAHYLELNSKYSPQESPNYVAFEGFLNAKIIVYALQQAGRDLTRQLFIKELESIKNYDVGIEKRISYGKDNHEGLNGIYYSQLSSNGRFEIFEID